MDGARDVAAGRPTLRQVAAEAGVSLKTASRVLNGHPHVTEATAARVRQAADRLGFRLNRIARELRSGATSTSVGLIISDLANPFYSRIARGAERVLRAGGLQLVTASTDEDAEQERSLVEELLERRVRALLLVPSAADHGYLAAERGRTPVVFLDRPPVNLDADTVLVDNRAGARAAVAHLLAGGHRRIGLVGDLSRLSTHRERMAGFADAMSDAGITFWQRYVRADSHDAATATRSTAELLAVDPPPTALFTTNNVNTAGALRALADRADPPALVGFDDFDLADVLGITVVGNEPEEMGRIAAEMVVARLAGDHTPARTVVLPTKLVPRGSGER
ncbi:LacI family DNA-binding transcriptional regulator [Actinocatenispora rupis]|uniref:LacI family transcriptional regulator n=1 Tax=Actinocatenispora rupis TaxID=519421 RepID=A0A8J3J3F6_9ACTN|nr:LacI family DNA-binding transcriptional regulator [Actinocatenispora rupis]GID11252.1 LacI family transcriptional regulator [Actinocatenispora rupis]